MLTILDRYIGRQLLQYFALGIVVFSLVAFFSDALLDFIKDMQRFGISLETSALMMALQFPKTVALVLPASSFLAVLLVYNALNNAFELIAMRMNGISLWRIMGPALLLGVFSTVSAYVLNDFVVPYCNERFEQMKLEAVSQGNLPFGSQSFTFQDFDANHRLRKLIHVGKFKRDVLYNSTIIDLSNTGILQVIQARTGKWYPDRWEFNNANAYTISRDSELLIFNHLEQFMVKNLLKPGEDALETAKEKEKQGKIDVSSDTQNFASLFSAIQEREARGQRVKRTTYIRLWEKLTLPMSCLVVILSAVPLAMTPPRRGGQRGFVFGVGVLFLYYLLRSVFVALGRSDLLMLGGLLPVQGAQFLAAWLPIMIMGGIGVVLLNRKSKVL